MQVRVIPKPDLAPLDRLLLDGEGRMRAISQMELATIPQLELSAWCHIHGRYHVPSREMVAWLKEQIADREALEIGAGAGDLGRLLGIRMTDSYVQAESLDIQLYYEALGVAPTSPAPDVERLEALAAVEKYQPEVVVGAWITQLYQKGDEGPPFIGSSIYGVDELKIRTKVKKYIHIGHTDLHHRKRLLRFRYKSYRLPFLFSRGFDPSGNVVHVWSRR